MVALKIAIALTTYGTNDVFYSAMFLRGLRRFGGAEFYSAVPKFNLPPLVIHLLDGVGRVSDATGLPFSFLFRLPAIIADAGSVWLVYLILRPLGEKRAAVRAAAVTLGPAWILISGFHGNIDGIMVFFVLLSVYLLAVRRELMWAACALGLAVNIKFAAMLFVPAFVFYVDTNAKRVRFLLIAAAIWIVTSLPYLATQPLDILRRLTGYTSIYGHWGLSRIVTTFDQDPDSFLNRTYSRHGGVLVLLLITGVAFVLNRGKDRPSLFVQGGLSAFLFIALTPGFGVQYLAWLAPWVVAFGLRSTLPHYATSGAFLFAVYTHWSGGFPWYYANSIRRPEWHGATIGLELIAWIVIAWIAMSVLAGNMRAKIVRVSVD